MVVVGLKGLGRMRSSRTTSGDRAPATLPIEQLGSPGVGKQSCRSTGKPLDGRSKPLVGPWPSGTRWKLWPASIAFRYVVESPGASDRPS